MKTVAALELREGDEIQHPCRSPEFPGDQQAVRITEVFRLSSSQIRLEYRSFGEERNLFFGHHDSVIVYNREEEMAA